METKTCSITEDEIRTLMGGYGSLINDVEEKKNLEFNMERINYLYKRLKAEKKEVETKHPNTPVPTPELPSAGELKSEPEVQKSSW